MNKRLKTSSEMIERKIEASLAPGLFVRDGACFEFVRALEKLEQRIQGLIETSPNQAMKAYEAFLAGCYEKANEVDDSSGSYGMFITGLFCGWIKARQAGGADAEETAACLVARMEDDPFGYCLYLANDALRVFDKAGIEAFEHQVRIRFDAVKTKSAEEPYSVLTYSLKYRGDVLRAIYIQQANLKSYEQITQQTELTPGDCHAMAILLMKRRRNADALKWVERGLGFGEYTSGSGQLAGLKRKILVKLDRSEEALQSAWAEYNKRPDKFSYQELMRFVPKNARIHWHEKAMAAANEAHLSSFIELLLEIKEIDRLADRLRRATDIQLESVSHFVTEPAAKQLSKKYPGLAARLWCAQGMRILNARKSKYYDAALSNFGEAKRCYAKAGLDTQWEEVVRRVHSQHHRKSGFMQGFKNLAAGKDFLKPRPSFLEHAKERWRMQPSRSRKTID